MGALDSKDPEKWSAATSRPRVSLLRYARFRLKQILIVLCALVLISGFAAHNVHRQDAVRPGVSWIEANGVAFLRGKSKMGGDPKEALPVNHLPADMDEFESLATSIAKDYDANEIKYREIFALTPVDRKLIPVNFNRQPVIDPMILPHPTEHDMWIILARRARPSGDGLSLNVDRNDDKPAEVESTEGQFSDKESSERTSPKQASRIAELTTEGLKQGEDGDDQPTQPTWTEEELFRAEAMTKASSKKQPIGEQHAEDQQKRHLHRRDEHSIDEQIVCPAARWNEHDGLLDCISDIAPIPQPSIVDEACRGKTDARVFYGPDVPFVTYGPRHDAECSGGWTQDARSILSPFHFEEFLGPRHFHNATRMGHLEDLAPADSKSFYFWDSRGDMFIQRSLFPRRVLGKIHANGAVSRDLAPTSRHVDQVCFGTVVPEFARGREHLEQATNSLSITMCERTDPKCVINDDTTFIVSMFHIKSSTDKALYKPYVVLFRRSAPFSLHAIAARPLWVHGRPDVYSITSMSWKGHSQKYHGYMDDQIFLGLTLGDSQSGAIDVHARDILQDLDMC